MGGPEQLQVQRFCEAAYDSSTGLTYSALIGLKKQSIGDVERLSLWCGKDIHTRHAIFALYETGAEQQMNEAYLKKIAQISTATS